MDLNSPEEGASAPLSPEEKHAVQDDLFAASPVAEPPKAPTEDDTEEASAEAESPETPAEAPVEGEAASADDPLVALADQATKGRLSSADEDRAATLLKNALLEGRKGVEHVVPHLPKLPWIVAVNGVSAAWPEMKTLYRARLIGGLAKIETESARRVRLSLARGLYKLDIPASIKLAIGVAKEIRDKETGAVTSKNAQIFANVLIGRAKPWIGQVSLAEVKPGDADLLVHCAVMAVFGLPHAPNTQLGILKWVAESGRLAKLHPAALESALKIIGRWNGKWQGALRREVAELPEEFTNVLNATAAGKTEKRMPEHPAKEANEESATAEPRASKSADAEASTGDDDEDDEHDREEDEDEDSETRETPTPAPPKQRPVYESKTMPSPQQQHQQPQQRRGQAPANFNLSDTLRQIEAHVAGLRSELQTTQTKLRQQQRDDDRKSRRGGQDRGSQITVPGEPSPQELARLNQQLENRIAEQQQRIEELTTDSEDRAASMSLPEASSPDAQLRALLSLKLKEDFEDFAALETESPDIVVQQHYRTVLRHVFEVLRGEGIRLVASAPEADSQG